MDYFSIKIGERYHVRGAIDEETKGQRSYVGRCIAKTGAEVIIEDENENWVEKPQDILAPVRKKFLGIF